MTPPAPSALHHTWRALKHHAARPRTWIARAGDRIDRLAVSYDRLITHMSETLTGRRL